MPIPLNRIPPLSGRSNPVIRLNTVVLPAPLGPINPRISPSATLKDSACTAMTPPKDFVRFSASSNRTFARPPLEPRRPRPQLAHYSRRHEEHHKDEQESVNKLVNVRKIHPKT